MDKFDVKTVILRFRDLVGGHGDTILEHRKIIETKKCVWWGWWNKAGEKVPAETFKNLLQIAKQDSLDLYLADSGQNLLYKAVCTDIKWDNGGLLIPSPNIDNTPDYYRNNRYYAWFQFTLIEDCKSEILNNFTYVRVDDFFESQPSKYDKFYGKMVYSVDELRQQDRTIWFIRDFIQKTDGINEVSLLDSMALMPENYVSQFINSKSINLLWLSDIHYSTGFHKFPIERPTGILRPLGLTLEDSLRGHRIDDFGGVIISGDITWSAKKEEYEMADKLLSHLSSWQKLKPYQFAICNGNHDIAFSDKPEVKDKAIEVPISDNKSKEAFNSFYKDIFYIRPNKFLSSGRRLLLGGSKSVEIVCLNSSYLEQTKVSFQGHGYIGHEQLTDVEEKMGWTNYNKEHPSPFRIAVLHHHLLPVTYREAPMYNPLYSVTLDAEALIQWALRNNVQLILHGHMHQPYYSQIKRSISLNDVSEMKTIHIAGMGSTSVNEDHLGDIKYNTYGVLSFTREDLKLQYFEFDGKGINQQLCNITIPYE